MDTSNFQIKLNKPYPKIEDAVFDVATVNILKNLAFSKQGELQAVLEYIFQSIIADKTDDDIGGLFEEIAVTEMIHLNLLMHAISDFGGVPKYETENGTPFNSSSINYTLKLKDMLQNNIEGEKQAIVNYQNAAARVKNESLKQLFNRIIEDEKLHVEAFQKLMQTVTFLSI